MKLGIMNSKGNIFVTYLENNENDSINIKTTIESSSYKLHFATTVISQFY